MKGTRVIALWGLVGALAHSGVVSCARADWAYVTSAWGGLALGSPIIEAKEVILPLELFVTTPTRVDSAICINGISGEVQKLYIRLSLSKGSCRASSMAKPFNLRIGRPAPGTYSVVYDDEAAGLPTLGTVEIP